jgi:hypothetical protein
VTVFYLNDKIPDGPAFLFRTEGGGSIQVRAGSPRGAGARSDGGNGGRAAAAGVAAAAAAAHAAKAVAIKLAWAASDSSPTCGRWPTDADDALLRAFGVKTDGLAWRCAHYTVMERMRRPRGGRDAPADTNATCATWCTERADKHRAADGSWCCHWKPTRGGREAGICEWSDGIALHDVAAAEDLEEEAAAAAAAADDSEPLALAFEPCPNITIDEVTPVGLRLSVERPARAPNLRKRFNDSAEYVCDTTDEKNSNNAMANFDNPKTGMCSQACVPSRFVGPAQKRGAIRGADCKQNDCSQFVRADTIVGVPFNVYTCTCPKENASAPYTCA